MSNRNYIELIEGSLANRGNFIETKDLKILPRHMEAYTSMFIYPDEAMSYILTNISQKTSKPSVLGYEGDVGIRSVYIDIDMEGALFDMKAHELRRILEIMETKWGLTKDNMQIYFSGSKGFHIAIPYKVFSKSVVFSPRAFEIVRSFLCELIDIPYEEESMKTSSIDFKTIHNTAVFRIPLSKHAKTGNYKIPIYDIKNLNESALLDDASRCEFGDYKKFLFKDYTYIEEVGKCFDECVEKVKTTPISEITVTNVKLSTKGNSIFKVPERSERNHELHRMAYRLFSINALKDLEVWDIMGIIRDATNDIAFKLGIDIIDTPEFNKLMGSALSKGKSDWIGEKVSIKDTTEAVSMGFDFLLKNIRIKTYIANVDRSKGGLLVGCSYLAIGKNGTRKSRVWFRTAMENARAGIPTIYYSGEMSEAQLAMMMIEYEYGIDAEEEFRAGKLDAATIARMSFDLGKVFSNLKFICKSDITEKELRSCITDIEKMIGKKVVLLIIDSLGSLKYINNNEVGSLIHYSKVLKEIAKDTLTCTIALNHVNQMCTHVDREPSKFVRGGGKLMDNCDGYFEHSLLRDENASSASKEEFHDGYVYMAYTSKRDKVKVEDFILKMDNCKIVDEVLADGFTDYIIVNDVRR